MASAGDKTEKPTPKRREDARRKGQVARSAEVNTAIVLLAGLGILAVLGPSIMRGLQTLLRQGIERAGDPENAEADALAELVPWALDGFFRAVAPVALAVLVAGVVASVIQVRLRVTPQALKPSFKKLNPLTGLKRVFGPAGIFEAAKAITKTAVVAFVAFLAVWPELPSLAALVGMDPRALPAAIGGLVLRVGLKSAAALVVVAGADYAWQRHRHEKQLKMTKDELKRELKGQDVAPEVRRRIRKKQFEMASRRMLADVPTADVVVTNPTHYAIALKYDGSSPAPQVVAVGVDRVAAAIRRVAEEHGVPVLSNPPLARALYRDVEVGQEIPEQFFHAVAEVLAFVYRTFGRRQRSA